MQTKSKQGAKMKSFAKKVMLGVGTLGALSSPVVAVEVYNNDEKNTKVEIYGSVRGYVGASGYSSTLSTQANEGSSSLNGSSVGTASALYGLQTNSRLGLRATVGNLFANAELGLNEPGIVSGVTSGLNFRHFYGAYSFGSAGKLIFGKTNTPSIPDEFYSSNVLNFDQGAVGYGSLRTASRHVQIRYSIAGFDIALVQDTVALATTVNQAIPRLALAYTYKGETTDFKIGGSYKYYYWDPRTTVGGQNNNDEADERFGGKDGSAFHVFLAGRKQMLEKKFFISGQVSYGVNADLYQEQRTGLNVGGYSHSEILNNNTLEAIQNGNVQRAGFYAESGYILSSSLKAVLGVGYQATWLTPYAGAQSVNENPYHGYTVMVQLPFNPQKNFTITPQISWYGSSSTGSYPQSTNLATAGHINSIVGVMRLRYDF